MIYTIYILGGPIIAITQGNAENTALVWSLMLGISIVRSWCWSVGGFLESCWFSVYVRTMKKFGFNICRINKADELACQSGSK